MRTCVSSQGLEARVIAQTVERGLRLEEKPPLPQVRSTLLRALEQGERGVAIAVQRQCYRMPAVEPELGASLLTDLEIHARDDFVEKSAAARLFSVQDQQVRQRDRRLAQRRTLGQPRATISIPAHPGEILDQQTCPMRIAAQARLFAEGREHQAQQVLRYRPASE